jgi:hypothetical protein
VSNDRLTGEHLERIANWAGDPEAVVAAKLAREVQEYRTLRPDCPTCEGRPRQGGYDAGGKWAMHLCPDCTDGKMPLDKWEALLVETLRSLRTDFAADGYPTVAYVPTIDAVLKMVPK